MLTARCLCENERGRAHPVRALDLGPRLAPWFEITDDLPRFEEGPPPPREGP
jgi:hypothetical protein